VSLPPALPPDVRPILFARDDDHRMGAAAMGKQTGQTILVESKQLIYEPRCWALPRCVCDRRLGCAYQQTVTRLVPIPSRARAWTGGGG